MSEEREIELDVDAVFPRLEGFTSGMRPRAFDDDSPPDPVALPPSRPVVPPPPPASAMGPALARLQEDVDLVIEATGRRLDDMEARQAEFERMLRGQLDEAGRRLREVERELEDTRHVLRDSHRRCAELAADLARAESRADELHARGAVAMARIGMLEHAQAASSVEPQMLESDLRRTPADAEVDPADSTTKIVRS